MRETSFVRDLNGDICSNRFLASHGTWSILIYVGACIEQIALNHCEIVSLLNVSVFPYLRMLRFALPSS